jgi:Icc-related predicted phosphoesterase
VGLLAPLLSSVNEQADVLLLCGDLTDYGTIEEAHVLAKELSSVRIPIIGVLGNHDVQSNMQNQLIDVLGDASVQILDGDAVEIRGIGIAGVKGFVGGFGRATLGAWGEPLIKQFVQEAIDEALRLEAALQRLRTERRIAVMHYAPVRGTVEGEPPEIFPYCGCGRLEEPLHRYPVDLVLHGHAHFGSAEAQTENGIPVYNVALPLLRRVFGGNTGYRVIELPPMSRAIKDMPTVR